MRAILLATGLIASATLAAADPADPAQATMRERNPHPALATHRTDVPEGYDYASKFYPHPAWLYLSAEAPHTMSQHPAVIVWERAQEERRLALEAAKRTVAKHSD